MKNWGENMKTFSILQRLENFNEPIQHQPTTISRKPPIISTIPRHAAIIVTSVATFPPLSTPLALVSLVTSISCYLNLPVQ